MENEKKTVKTLITFFFFLFSYKLSLTRFLTDALRALVSISHKIIEIFSIKKKKKKI